MNIKTIVNFHRKVHKFFSERSLTRFLEKYTSFSRITSQLMFVNAYHLHYYVNSYVCPSFYWQNSAIHNIITGASLGFFQEGCVEQMWSTFFTSKQPFQVEFSWNRYFYWSIFALRRGAPHPLSNFSVCRRPFAPPSNEAPELTDFWKSLDISERCV